MVPRKPLWSFLPDQGQGSEERPGKPEKPQEKWTQSWLSAGRGARQVRIQVLALHTAVLRPWASYLMVICASASSPVKWVQWCLLGRVGLTGGGSDERLDRKKAFAALTFHPSCPSPALVSGSCQDLGPTRSDRRDQRARERWAGERPEREGGEREKTGHPGCGR